MELVDVAVRLLDGGATLFVAYILVQERQRNSTLVDWIMTKYDRLLERALDQRLEYAMEYSSRRDTRKFPVPLPD